MRMWSGTMAVVAAAATLTSAACGSEDASGEWAGTVTDSAGIPVVQNPVRGLWAPDEAWQVEEIFRVGGMDADTAYQFGAVTGVDVADDGRVLVTDQQARTVRVFDAEGVLVNRIGSPGQGPGELGPGLLGVFEEGGSVIIPDIAQGRLQLFGLDGEFVRMLQFNPLEGIPLRWDEDARGRIAVQRRSMRMEDGAPVIGETGDVLVTLNEDGVNRDTLLTFPSGTSFSASGGNAEMVIFNPEPVWDLSSSGAVALGVNDDFRIRILENGEVARIVTLAREAVPVTEGEEARIRDATRQVMEDFGNPPEAVNAILGQMRFAESYPLFAQLLLASDGSLWVQRVLTARSAPDAASWSFQDFGSNEWDVFGPDGRYLGVVTLPLRFEPLREIDGVLWGVDQDELDVQSVVGLRIVKPGA